MLPETNLTSSNSAVKEMPPTFKEVTDTVMWVIIQRVPNYTHKESFFREVKQAVKCYRFVL